ncbi:MAG: Kazal-type serine protease inhibitor domain protein [Gammaproteobacteria bacterium]|nr:Kazal-type serine protease inhibitor domain protein [Gammaproteobacteria bacterium]
MTIKSIYQSVTHYSRQTSHNTGLLLTACFFFVGFMCLSKPAQAEVIKTQYQYAAKVVCSLLTPHQDGDLAKGIYHTSINVHNPTDRKVTFADKVALSGSPGTEPGEFSVTPFEKTTLAPDGAVQFTCGNIAGFFCPINGVCIDFAFLDGFLVIKSPVKLDVVGVYTARSVDGEVESIDVERVPARKIVSKTDVYKRDKEIKSHMPYTPGYGFGDNQLCGGIAGLQCPKGLMCIDDPKDNCDPNNGGADCSGICVKK